MESFHFSHDNVSLDFHSVALTMGKNMLGDLQGHRLTRESRTCWCWWRWCSRTLSIRSMPPPASSSPGSEFDLSIHYLSERERLSVLVVWDWEVFFIWVAAFFRPFSHLCTYIHTLAISSQLPLADFRAKPKFSLRPPHDEKCGIWSCDLPHRNTASNK